MKMRFRGRVRSGMGKHSKMVVPGRTAISSAPTDWPESFFPGSLNIGLSQNGYPDGFRSPELGGSGVSHLDAGNPRPAFVLPSDQIKKNGLKPTRDKPERGTGQFWRVVLTNVSTGETLRCWLFRRIGSTINSQLELIATCPIRDELSLADGTDVYVDLVAGVESEQSV